jgi:anti-sigma B factor antagonist
MAPDGYTDPVSDTSRSIVPFNLSVQEGEDVHRVIVAGELDAATGPRLRTALSDLAGRSSANGGHDVLVDLTDVRFMDSTGLGVIVKSAGQMRRSERSLRVTGAQERVRQVFETAGMTSLLADPAD